MTEDMEIPEVIEAPQEGRDTSAETNALNDATSDSTTFVEITMKVEVAEAVEKAFVEVIEASASNALSDSPVPDSSDSGEDDSGVPMPRPDSLIASDEDNGPGFNSNQLVVMDNIEGQTDSVKGATAGLKMANESPKLVQELQEDLEAESPEREEEQSASKPASDDDSRDPIQVMESLSIVPDVTIPSDTSGITESGLPAETNADQPTSGGSDLGRDAASDPRISGGSSEGSGLPSEGEVPKADGSEGGVSSDESPGGKASDDGYDFQTDMTGASPGEVQGFESDEETKRYVIDFTGVSGGAEGNQGDWGPDADSLMADAIKEFEKGDHPKSDSTTTTYNTFDRVTKTVTQNYSLENPADDGISDAADVLVVDGFDMKSGIIPDNILDDFGRVTQSEILRHDLEESHEVENSEGSTIELEQRNNEIKSEVREEILMLQDELDDWPDDGETRTITYTELVRQPDGTYKMVEKTENLTKDRLRNLIKDMEATYEHISEGDSEGDEDESDITTSSYSLGSGTITVGSIGSAEMSDSKLPGGSVIADAMRARSSTSSSLAASSGDGTPGDDGSGDEGEDGEDDT
jgi:hypothetical protein